MLPSRPSRIRVADRRPTPRRLEILVALAVGLTSAGVLASPPPVAARDSGVSSSTSEWLLTALTNRTRTDADLPALEVDDRLATIARWRSEDMAVRDYFSHSIPPGNRKVFDTMTARGYCYEVAGENIGWLGGADDGAEAWVHQKFLESPTHRAVLLGKAWDVIGIGSFKRADGRKYWTVLFAAACDSTAAAAARPTTPDPSHRESASPSARATLPDVSRSAALLGLTRRRVPAARDPGEFLHALIAGIAALVFDG